MPAQLQTEASTPARKAREPLVCKPEVAAHIKCSLRAVDDYMRARKIPFIKLSNRAVRFRLSDVERALAKLEVQEIGR
jgi:hypothetical protein